jgi:site-specific recombinase XerD
MAGLACPGPGANFIITAVRIPAYRACLTTVSACGLRANEGAHLRVEHIDSGRMLLRIIQGKGNQDRYVFRIAITNGRLERFSSTRDFVAALRDKNP